MSELEQLPFDLAFPGPPPRMPDLAGLRARGNRRRHRSQAGFAGGAVLTVSAVVAAVAAGSATTSYRVSTAGSWLAKEHPPAVGAPAALPTLKSGWLTQAWVAADGDYCTVSFKPGDRSSEAGDCNGANASLGSGPTQIVFPIASSGPEDIGANFVTFVRGPATSLRFTAFGHTTTVPLTVLPTRDGSVVEVSWTALPGFESAPGYDSTDITRLVALDSAGKPVAEWVKPVIK